MATCPLCSTESSRPASGLAAWPSAVTELRNKPSRIAVAAVAAGAVPSVGFGGAGGFGGLVGRLICAATLGQATCTSRNRMAKPAKQWMPLGTSSVVQPMNNQPTNRPPFRTNSSSDWRRYTQIARPVKAGRKMAIEYSAASALRFSTVIANTSFASSTDEVNASSVSTCNDWPAAWAASSPRIASDPSTSGQPRSCPSTFRQSRRCRPVLVAQRMSSPPANAANPAIRNDRRNPTCFSRANPVKSGRWLVGETLPATNSSRYS